jgi:Fe-S-cluster-containing dehydrogenase component/DMSO reductase anchor subunit
MQSRYQDLIPLEAPGENEQYSFEVDLDACSGCKACVAACHSLNGLEEGELWRNVGLLIGGADTGPVVQHVTSACHHCLEPACMHGCPVNAYEKDLITGIVSHLDDQCIGCKYCMLTCPYDVPTFSPEKGIVRKCNMCADRLSVGEAPACVQACPNQAIKIRTVSREDIVTNSETDQLVPGAPDVHLTMPTTRYNTNRVLPRNLLPDDYYIAKPLHAHWPLVFMLTLTQMAFGIFSVSFLMESMVSVANLSRLTVANLAGFFILVVGLNVAILHLGRPLKAYRAMAGIRTSWLSREIAGFNLFAMAASGALAWGLFGFLTDWFGDFQILLAGATVVAGAMAVTCSAMLYVVTGRPLWSGFRTHALFFLTAAVLGSASVLFLLNGLSLPQANFLTNWIGNGKPLIASGELKQMGAVLCQLLIGVSVVKLVTEAALLTHLRAFQYTPQRHAARLMIGDLWFQTALRFSLGVVGGLGLPLLYLSELLAQPDVLIPNGLMVVATLMLALLVVAELTERYLFFAITVARRMPGAPN